MNESPWQCPGCKRWHAPASMRCDCESVKAQVPESWVESQSNLLRRESHGTVRQWQRKLIEAAIRKCGAVITPHTDEATK